MKKWEYKVLGQSDLSGPGSFKDTLQKKLCDLGKEGWRVVPVVMQQSGTDFLLEREVAEKVPTPTLNG